MSYLNNDININKIYKINEDLDSQDLNNNKNENDKFSFNMSFNLNKNYDEESSDNFEHLLVNRSMPKKQYNIDDIKKILSSISKKRIFMRNDLFLDLENKMSDKVFLAPKKGIGIKKLKLIMKEKNVEEKKKMILILNLFIPGILMIIL